ncbi:MAG: replication protein RepA [Gammaproteobacteria bacterium]
MSKQGTKKEEGTINPIASMKPDHIRHLDSSTIDKISWSDFSRFNDEQLIAIGELLNKSETDAFGFCYTIPPFVLGPLPQSSYNENHFSRKFRWQQIDYSNSHGEKLPCGSAARIILFHIITTLVHTGEPYVDLKENVSELMRSFGITPSYGEKGTVRKYEEALLALMRTVIGIRTTRVTQTEQVVEEIRFPIFCRDSMRLNKHGIVAGMAEVSQDFANVVAQSRVVLHRPTVVELCKHRSPAALDIYIWGTYTDFYLRKSGKHNITLTWDEVYELFSTKTSPKNTFRRDFAKKVEIVTNLYPQLKLIPTKKCVTLWRTQTHVKPVDVKKPYTSVRKATSLPAG